MNDSLNISVRFGSQLRTIKTNDMLVEEFYKHVLKSFGLEEAGMYYLYAERSYVPIHGNIGTYAQYELELRTFEMLSVSDLLLIAYIDNGQQSQELEQEWAYNYDW